MYLNQSDFESDIYQLLDFMQAPMLYWFVFFFFKLQSSWRALIYLLKLAEVFAKDGMSFLASCQSLVSRPWVIDDLDLFKLKWSRKSWKKVYLFFLPFSLAELIFLSTLNPYSLWQNFNIFNWLYFCRSYWETCMYDALLCGHALTRSFLLL